jgi:mono/diheme cytochrome c family protein
MSRNGLPAMTHGSTVAPIHVNRHNPTNQTERDTQSMKHLRLIFVVTVLAIPATVLLTGSRAPSEASSNPIERGRYLVNVAGCADCHTPHKLGAHGPEPDRSRHLAGHPEDAQLPPPPKLPPGPWIAATVGDTAWAGPWGVSYSANLTPDQNTGLGIWTEAMFIQALRTGKHFGVGRPILPPMPWQALSQMSDADLKAIFAYLRSVPAIKNHVPDALPPGGERKFE